MKTKMYSLRSQKLELDRRLSEMESTIASLRDERKVIESTLEEKKNEIKMLTEGGMNSSFPNDSDLRNMIKMKETEVEHLKLQLNLTETSLSMTTGDNRSQTEGSIQEGRENLANETEKSNDEDDEDEPRMRQEAASRKWVDEHGGGAILVNVHENQEKKTEVGVQNVTEAKVNYSDISHDNPRDQGSRQSMSTLRVGLKSDVGLNGLGIKVRRRHYRGQRFSDIRNRRSVDSLYSGITDTGGLSNQDANAESNNSQKQAGPKEVHLSITEKLNETQTVGGDDGESTETKSETKSKGTEKSENADNEGSLSKGDPNKNGKARFSSDGESERLVNAERNVEKQVADKIDNGHDVDANRKLLKTTNLDVQQYKVKNEGNEAKETEEGEGDDSEDPREPEIDRADIKRFAESDPDEEEAEEADEETEF